MPYKQRVLLTQDPLRFSKMNKDKYLDGKN
jgi:hypothetical protein